MTKFNPNFITKLVTTLAMLPLSIAAPEAQARNVDSAHMALGRAVMATGVTLKVNPVECMQSPDAFGWYAAYKNEMVICQERGVANGVEVNWTGEDLDTLRHEAQHLVQDCMDGRLNGRLGAVYQDPIGLAKSVLGMSSIRGILRSYANQSEHIQVMELEAFSVAALNDPLEQVRDIQKYCF